MESRSLLMESLSRRLVLMGRCYFTPWKEESLDPYPDLQLENYLSNGVPMVGHSIYFCAENYLPSYTGLISRRDAKSSGKKSSPLTPQE